MSAWRQRLLAVALGALALGGLGCGTLSRPYSSTVVVERAFEVYVNCPDASGNDVREILSSMALEVRRHPAFSWSELREDGYAFIRRARLAANTDHYPIDISDCEAAVAERFVDEFVTWARTTPMTARIASIDFQTLAAALAAEIREHDGVPE